MEASKQGTSSADERVEVMYVGADLGEYISRWFLGLMLTLFFGILFLSLLAMFVLPIVAGIFAHVYDKITTRHSAEALVVERKRYKRRRRTKSGYEEDEGYHVTVHFDYEGKSYSCKLDCITDEDVIEVYVDPSKGCIVTGTEETKVGVLGCFAFGYAAILAIVVFIIKSLF
ncbi:MAG: hypothetical protein II951_06715 [Bacteroidales bacterium]|nr:hypothetical protein [Bacteroidales bacterium]